MKILVTSAAGFIGSHLAANKLLERGDEVVGLDCINDYYDINVKYGRLARAGIQQQQIEYNKILQSESQPNYNFIKLVLVDKEQLMRLFAEQQFDAVCNLAAQAGVRYSLTNPDAYIESNIIGFTNILEACRHHKVNNLSYASSFVYGLKGALPFSSEHNVEHPISLYAASKKTNELMAHTYFHLFGITTCNICIVTVPTPIDKNKRPDLTSLIKASETIGKTQKKEDIVIYESTVYPGATEEDCVPILEHYSGLKFNQDFYCGYSPERINPGDKVHTVTKIKKVTSGSISEIAQKVDALYKAVITAGTHLAPTIKVAEAAKVIDNSQRDINIAFVNELAVIFNKMNINTHDVLAAAGSKWNFLPFKPGLVGWHCIGVDPYYLTHKAQELGYNPEIIPAGRRLNDGMGIYVANQIIKLMIKKGQTIDGANVVVLGITFKENCPDIRNSKVIDVINELQDFGCNIDIYDPWADITEVQHEYDLTLLRKLHTFSDYAAIVLAVAHDEYKTLDIKLNQQQVVYDIKSVLTEADATLSIKMIKKQLIRWNIWQEVSTNRRIFSGMLVVTMFTLSDKFIRLGKELAAS
ncbi:MAG: nucleotide sugar dehydrogenase [Methyloprofundus sp.]|nr:nucleotide sugar dehydrogenase [Methyloprofundus sp.]